MNILGFPINKREGKINKSIRETEDRDLNESRNIETGTLPLVNNLVSLGMKKIFSRDIKVKRDEELEPKNVNNIKSDKEEDVFNKLNKWKEDRVLETYKNNNLSKDLLSNDTKVTQGQKDVILENNYDPVEYSRNTIKEKEGNYNNGNEFRVQNLELENSYSSSGNGKVISNWKTNKKIFSSSNKSEEEIKNIFALKNRNTYNKSLGYIYIDSNKIYDGSNDDVNNRLRFQIPFEFNPEISEGGTQANYVSETLLNRIGQYQVYTGTNLSQLSITLKYMALAPDEIDKEMQDNMSKQFSTDSWQYYWTNNRIEEIEYKLRSLVFPDVTSGDYLIKPPLIEVHFNNGSDKEVDSVGDLFKYPIGVNKENKEIDEKYLSVTRSLTSDDSINRYKKYIVTNVQIDNLNEDSLSWPSLYGRVWRDGKSGAPINHIMTAKDFKKEENTRVGFLGNIRRTGFKATLQCIEVTENFLDIVPDFKAYYDAWNYKSNIADYTSDYASATLNENLYATTDFLTASLNSAIYGIASLEESLNLKFEEAYILSLLYKNAKTKNRELWKLNEGISGSGDQEDYYFINKFFLKEQDSNYKADSRDTNLKELPLFEVPVNVAYEYFYTDEEKLPKATKESILESNIDSIKKDDIEKVTGVINPINEGIIKIDGPILFGEEKVPTNKAEGGETLDIGYDTETVLNALKNGTCISARESNYSDVEASLIMKKMLYGKEILDNEAIKYTLEDNENRESDIEYCYKKLYKNEKEGWPVWITDFKDEIIIYRSDEVISYYQSIINNSENIIKSCDEIISNINKAETENAKKEAETAKAEAEINKAKAKEEIENQQIKINEAIKIIKNPDSTEAAKKEAEAAKKEAEAKKAEAEKTKKEAEKEISIQQNKINEAKEKLDQLAKAEKTKKEAENAKKEAETAKAEAESKKKGQQEERTKLENEKAEAEAKKAEAEKTKADAEAKINEAIDIIENPDSTEAAKKEAEKAKAEAENAKAEAEAKINEAIDIIKNNSQKLKKFEQTDIENKNIIDTLNKINENKDKLEKEIEDFEAEIRICQVLIKNQQEIIDDETKSEEEKAGARKEIENQNKKISDYEKKIASKKQSIAELEKKEEEIDLPSQRKQLFNTFFYYDDKSINVPNMENDFNDLGQCLDKQFDIDLEKDMEFAKTYLKVKLSEDEVARDSETIENYTTDDGGTFKTEKISYSGKNIYTTDRYVKKTSNANADANIRDMMEKEEGDINTLDKVIEHINDTIKGVNNSLKDETKESISETITNSIKTLEDLEEEVEGYLFLNHKKVFSLTYIDSEKSNKNKEEYYFFKIKSSKIKETMGNLIEKLNIIKRNIETAKEVFIKADDAKNLLKNEYKSTFKKLIEWQSLGLVNGGKQKVITEKGGRGLEYRFIEASEKKLVSKDDIEELKENASWILNRPKNYKGESYLNFYGRYNNSNDIKRVDYSLSKDDMEKYFYEDETEDSMSKYYHLYTAENHISNKVFQIGITKDGKVNVYAMSQKDKVDDESAFIMLCYIPSDILKEIYYRIKNGSSYSKGNLYNDYLEPKIKEKLGIEGTDILTTENQNILIFKGIIKYKLEIFERQGNLEKNLTVIPNGWDYCDKFDKKKGLNFVFDLKASTTSIIYKNEKDYSYNYIIKESDKKEGEGSSVYRTGQKLTPIDIYDIEDKIIEEIGIERDNFIDDKIGEEKKDHNLYDFESYDFNSNWTKQNTQTTDYYKNSACSGIPRDTFIKKDWNVEHGDGNSKYLKNCYTFRNKKTGEVARISNYEYYFGDKIKEEKGLQNAFNIPSIAVKDLAKMLEGKKDLKEEEKYFKAYSDSMVYYDDFCSVFFLDSDNPDRNEIIKRLSYKGKFGEKQKDINWNTQGLSLKKITFSLIIRNIDGESYQLAYSDSKKEYYLYNSESSRPYLTLELMTDEDASELEDSSLEDTLKILQERAKKYEEFGNEIIKIFPQKALEILNTKIKDPDYQKDNYTTILNIGDPICKLFTPKTFFGEKALSYSESYFSKKDIMPWSTSNSLGNFDLYKNKNYKKDYNQNTGDYEDNSKYPYNLIVIKFFDSGRIYQIGKDIYGKAVLFEKGDAVELNSVNFKKLNLLDGTSKTILDTLGIKKEDIEVTVSGPSKEIVDDSVKIKEHEVSILKENSYKLSNIRDIVMSMIKGFNKVKDTFNKLYESIKEIGTENLDNGYKTIFQDLANIKFIDASSLEVDDVNKLSFEESVELSKKVLNARDKINLNLVNFRNGVKKIYNIEDGLSYEGLQNKFTKVVGNYESSKEPYIKGLKKLDSGYGEYSESKDALRKKVFKKWDDVEDKSSTLISSLTSAKENFPKEYQDTKNGEIPKAYNDMWMANEKLSQMKVAGDNIDLNVERLS